MTYTTMWAYPWDLLDDDAEAVTRRLREGIGLDAVSVATSYHSVEQLRPHTKGARRLFQARDAAIYFQPDSSMWQDAPIKPNVSPLTESVNPLEVVCEAAAKAGLKVESWTVCLHNSTLGRAHPDAAQQNVFGDVYAPYLCPSNEGVRQYATTLTRDLATNYPLFAVELESLTFGGFGHFHGHEKIGLELGRIGRFLMSLCFCDSCRKRARAADIDADALAAKTSDWLTHIFERGAPSGFEQTRHVRDLVAEHADLKAFLDMREAVVTSLHRDVKEAVGDAFLVAMNMGDPSVTGFNGKACAEIADAFELLCYTAQPDMLEQQVSHATTAFCDADDLIVGLSVFTPHTPAKRVLDSNVQRALSMGARGFSFYNYGIMPEPHLDWVKASVELIRAAD